MPTRNLPRLTSFCREDISLLMRTGESKMYLRGQNAQL